MKYFRTAINTLLWGSGALLWLGLSTLCAFPVLYFWPGKDGHRVRKFVYIQSKGILVFIRLCAKKLTVEKTDTPLGPCVVTANHQSALDLYTVAALGFDNVLYITKGWVFNLPFFRFVMNGAGYIDAEKTPPQIMLEQCRKAAQNGCAIMLFPQGSRKNPQARFKSGAFFLAEQLNLPVVPMAISGTGKMLPVGSIWLRASRVVLKQFEPISPRSYSGELGHLKMAQDVKKKIMDFVNTQEAK